MFPHEITDSIFAFNQNNAFKYKHMFMWFKHVLVQNDLYYWGRW